MSEGKVLQSKRAPEWMVMLWSTPLGARDGNVK